MPRRSNQGGPRPNAGRHPAHISVPALPPNCLGPAPPACVPLADLSAPKQLAIKLHCRGWNNFAIAERLGKDRGTIASWIAKHPDIVEAEVAALADPAESLRQHLPAATQAYGAALEPGVRPDIRLAAADRVYDRVYGKPIIRQEIKARVESVVVFIDADD